jgi:tetratricopeptide (TPR) repeat protein
MALRRAGLVLAGCATLALLTMPAIATAQDCVGSKPRGGRYATSAELYLDRARTNPKPEDKARLYRQAVDVLLEGFEAQPDNPRNYVMAGQAYAGLRDYEAADAAYTKAEEMWSCYAGRVDTLRHGAWIQVFNRAVGYFRNDEVETAIREYNNAWIIYRGLPQPMLQLGIAYGNEALTAETSEARSELQQKAIESYGKALELLAGRPARLSEAQQQEFLRAAAFNMAQLLAFDERFEEAARAYDTFLDHDPGNVDAMSNAAVVITRASMQTSDQADELEDGPEKEALLAKSDSLQEVANSYYRELLAREDLEAADYHNIGVGLLQIGLYEEGAVAFAKALEFGPYRMNSLEQLARVFFSAQRYDTLAAIAQTLVERYPLNLDNLALLANAYRELEQPEDALAILERREALPAEVRDLDVEWQEGTYTITGYLANLAMEPDTPVELQFDFYDAFGELVSSETVTVAAPAQEAETEFSVGIESDALISGFTYKPLNLETAPAGT